MILILGPTDVHTERVADSLRRRNADVEIVASQDFPGRLGLAYGIDEAASGLLALSGGKRISLADVQAVYWYALTGFAPPPDYPYDEAESAFGGFVRNLSGRWINPPQAVALHRYKTHQLKLLKQAGIRVPDSLVTNHPDSLRRFYEEHRGNVICKPIQQGLLLHRLTEADLTEEKMARLAQSPLLFQEFVSGQDIRVHVVGEATFASAIVSDSFNYKTDFRCEPVTVPDEVLAQCRLAARTLGLVLAGVDLRRTPGGEYVMFEANPSPQYLIFEDQCGFPITETLVDELLGNG